MVMEACDERTARAVALERLHEIQENARRWKMPDANWAEVLVRTPTGVWTQAFGVQDTTVKPLTVVTWVPML